MDQYDLDEKGEQNINGYDSNCNDQEQDLDKHPIRAPSNIYGDVEELKLHGNPIQIKR